MAELVLLPPLQPAPPELAARISLERTQPGQVFVQLLSPGPSARSLEARLSFVMTSQAAKELGECLIAYATQANLRRNLP